MYSKCHISGRNISLEFEHISRSLVPVIVSWCEEEVHGKLKHYCMQSIMEYEEHEKRAWSVDFSRTEPTMLVSGSDDGKVCNSLLHLLVKLQLQHVSVC